MVRKVVWFSCFFSLILGWNWPTWQASMPSQLPLLHLNFWNLCPCSWWKLISFWLVVIRKILSEFQSLVWVLLLCPQYCDVLICFASFPFYHVWWSDVSQFLFLVSLLYFWDSGAGPSSEPPMSPSAEQNIFHRLRQTGELSKVLKFTWQKGGVVGGKTYKYRTSLISGKCGGYRHCRGDAWIGIVLHHLECQGFKKTMMEKGLMLLDVPDGPLLLDGETQTALGHLNCVELDGLNRKFCQRASTNFSFWARMWSAN